MRGAGFFARTRQFFGYPPLTSTHLLAMHAGNIGRFSHSSLLSATFRRIDLYPPLTRHVGTFQPMLTPRTDQLALDRSLGLADAQTEPESAESDRSQELLEGSLL